MRVALALVSLLLSSVGVCQEPGDERWARERIRCAAIEVPGPFEHHGRRLVEIPDVEVEAMRLANLQLSSSCYEEARAALETFVAANPNHPQGLYVVARWVWVTSGVRNADRTIDQLIALHPDFASLHVLQAGVRIDQGRLFEAAAILDRVEPLLEDDLWIYMDRLRIEAQTAPSDDVRRELREILNDAKFPPNARETAAFQLRRTQYVTADEFEASYRDQLAFVSAAPLGCKLHNYAVWMIEGQGRFADALEFFEPYMDRDDIECAPPQPGARILLAYAYLVLAAEMANQPAAVNAHYVARADQLLRGDYPRLASWLGGRPREAMLEPFLAPHLGVDPVDPYGQTRICQALLMSNVETVRTELERGANPEGPCMDNSLPRLLPLMTQRHLIYERREILRLLLEHGATVDAATYCNPSDDYCVRELLPIVERYGGE